MLVEVLCGFPFCLKFFCCCWRMQPARINISTYVILERSPTAINLHRHKESLHKNQNIKSEESSTAYICACRRSINENIIKQHVSTKNLDINPFACDICDFSKTSRINLLCTAFGITMT